MVGRFVEDEQVAWFEQESDHREAASLASTKNFHLLFAGFSSEHEGAKDVADLRPDVSRCHKIDGLEDGLEDGEVFIQERCLILCEVADLDVVADFECSEVVELPHYPFLDRQLRLHQPSLLSR